jgi:uncharacterized tellurite resistance protein B-like protein
LRGDAAPQEAFEQVLDAIKTFVTRRIVRAPSGPQAPEGSSGPDPIQLAACALLLELAHADDEFSPAERDHIEAALRRHFGLDVGTARELIELAQVERQEAIDYYQFARIITQHYDLGQRMVLAEVMWGVVLTDGHMARHESYLMRKLANLLDLAPAYLAQARRAATPPP